MKRLYAHKKDELTMAYNYEKVLAKINKDFGEQTTFYIRNLKHYKFEGTVEDFIYWAYAQLKANPSMLCTNTGGRSTRQCKPNALRSIGDMYKLAKHYIPNVTLKQIREEMYCANGRGSWCSTVKKRVFIIGQRDSTFWGRGQHSYGADEYGEITTVQEYNEMKQDKLYRDRAIARMA